MLPPRLLLASMVPDRARRARVRARCSSGGFREAPAWRSALVLGLVAFTVSCERNTAGNAGGGPGKLDVVCTTGMIADAARIIGADRAQVAGLMGPGVDPHLYLASRQDQRRLKKADLVLYHGLHLEGKMVEFLEHLAEEARPDQLVVAVATVIPRDKLISHPNFGDYPDPHVWFDLRLWADVAREIVRAFVARDPAGAAAYEKRGAAYLEEIARLDEWARRKSAELPEGRRRIVTSHDAYNYLARAYGFEVRGLQGISTVDQAGLEDIRAAVEYIRRHRIPVIFTETSVPHNAVERVARSAGCRIASRELYSDALGKAGTPEESFLGVFRYNLETIVEELGEIDAGKTAGDRNGPQ